jgi:Domain of unknown function (DUF4488)
MKSLLTCIVVILFFSFILPGTILAQSGILEGTWELVSSKTTSPDGTVTERTLADPDDKGGSIKILNATHFAVISQRKDGAFSHVHGGVYTVEGNIYSEKLSTSSWPSQIGWDNVIEFTLQGDIWKIKYNSGDKSITEETWSRVKAE